MNGGKTHFNELLSYTGRKYNIKRIPNQFILII